MLEHYAAGANNRYLHLRFIKILRPVRTGDSNKSLGSPVFWHKTDNEEVYKGAGRTLEREINMPMSWLINIGEGDIHRCLR